MWAVGTEVRGCATVPWSYSVRGVLFTAAAARAARALGEAGRGASPTAGKREGISF